MSVTEYIPETKKVLRRVDAPTSGRQARFLRSVPAQSLHAARTDSHKLPWWLWWNILSLDAPTVAAVWALLFARVSGVRLAASEVIDLSLIVWVIYTGDRLLDGWSARSLTPLQERHRFCARHRVALAFLGILAAAAILWLTAGYMAPAETKAGLQLGAIVGAYIAGIHFARGRVAQVAPKEIAVGALFAAGTTLPVWSQNAALPWDVWVSVILFALLCAVNCLSIESWENHRSNDAWLGTPQPLVRWANSRIDVIAAALAISALIVVLVGHTKTHSSSELWAISLSALLIVLLNRNRHRLSRRGLRVLADAALVLPGLLALMIRM